MTVHLPDLHDHSEIGHGKSGEGEESSQADSQESSSPESLQHRTCCSGGATKTSPKLSSIFLRRHLEPESNLGLGSHDASDFRGFRGEDQDCSPVTGAFKQRIVSLVNVGPFKVSGLDIAVKLLKAEFDEAEQQIPNVVAAVKNDGMLCVPHKRSEPRILEPQLGHGDRPVLRHGRGSSRGSHKTHRGCLQLAPFFNKHGWY